MSSLLHERTHMKCFKHHYEHCWHACVCQATFSPVQNTFCSTQLCSVIRGNAIWMLSTAGRGKECQFGISARDGLCLYKGDGSEITIHQSGYGGILQTNFSQSLVYTQVRGGSRIQRTGSTIIISIDYTCLQV